MREKSWKCGQGWISVRHKCYTDPSTGKINYREVKNPKTGKIKTVKVGIDYETYRRERAATIKKLGQLTRYKKSGLEPTNLRDLQLLSDTFDLRDRSRNKHDRIRNQKITKESLKSGKLIKSDWEKIPVAKGSKDKSADILRSPFSIGKKYSDVLYKVGDNKILMTANEMNSFDKTRIIEESNLLDIFKANKIDFNKIEPIFYNVNFKVNDNYSSFNENIIPLKNQNRIKTSIKITQAAAKAHNQILDSLPDFSILSNKPLISDGKGLSREKLYLRIGYGTLIKDKYHISQAMVKIGQKVYPLAKKIKR